VMATWVFSLIMLRASRSAPSPSSPARLNLVFDPGRSRRALRVRPQEEHGGPPRSPRAGRLAAAGLDLAGTPLGTPGGFRVEADAIATLACLPPVTVRLLRRQSAGLTTWRPTRRPRPGQSSVGRLWKVSKATAAAPSASPAAHKRISASWRFTDSRPSREEKRSNSARRTTGVN